MSGPRSLRLLARLLLPSSDREFIIGDLEELYVRRAKERGVVFAGVPSHMANRKIRKREP